jgi:serine-type D-Ala-D-Ala carboxypeptidase (penicillin-binding protein 5/6)
MTAVAAAVMSRPPPDAKDPHNVKRPLLVAVATLMVSAVLGVATAAATGPPQAQRAQAARTIANGTIYRPLAEVPAPPGVRADAWTVVDMDTGEILGKHLARKRLPQASTIKLLTALTAMHRVSATKPVVATRLAARTICSCAGVRAGRRYTRSMLLGGMLVKSGNDAAEALAGGDRGGRSRFVTAMNRTAARLGATDTVAKNPSGLDQFGAHSSARDLLVFLREAASRRAIAPWIDRRYLWFGPLGGGRRLLETTTDYTTMYAAESYAAKNGYTTDAGNTLVVATEIGGHRIGAAVLDAPAGWTTRGARDLTEWAATNRTLLGPVGALP